MFLRYRRWPLLSLSILLFCCAPGNGQAQEDVALRVQQFEPSGDGLGFFTVESARTTRLGRPIFNFHLNYSSGVLGTWNGDELVSWAVRRQLGVDLQVGMGFNVVDVVLLVPFAPYQDGSGMSGESMGIYHPFGDITIKPKVRILDPDTRKIGVAVALPISLPTGTEENLYGESSVTVSPTAIAQVHVGIADFGVNLGFRARQKTEVAGLVVGTQFLYRFAARLWFARPLSVQAELWGYAGGNSVASSPANWLVGTHVANKKGFMIHAGIGTGIGAGYGAPKFRFVFGFGVGIPALGDRDHDKIGDQVDACPDDPEDVDGFEDEEGCPDPDNDGDGFLDLDDQCPDERETVNKYQDTDGCPDEAPDPDEDGILTPDDACPEVPEDMDGFEDEDGCPEPDNDGDGIADEVDQCPEQAEAFNSYKDKDGCPDEAPVRVDSSKGQIVTKEKIFFDSGKTTLKPESFPVMNQIAELLERNPDLGRIEIQGHTDERGGASTNRSLSQKRAEAVRTYLVNMGADPGKLLAKGFGEDKPLDDGHDEDAWARNRRVEFHILGKK